MVILEFASLRGPSTHCSHYNDKNETVGATNIRFGSSQEPEKVID